ncbi:triphosphoribosyl-dephospho-CoA synthase [Methanobacterium petrolearium]|uniref:triphosphoribosyl-dephospho-CoA synthase n=1 Tax=Methanobacterium petrolearium TaxID=710190 RepID=UPI001AE13717|nr:triphosphoribosyl-dephospho-CoA synthase [Methanobacterium petrolearium]MBP1945224.1 triphosphoribosyl-dephospho-CoA synthase [Methanobacterium petrolearium]BDZ71158.1 triphosphoribosyl-dephospho-CoA synthase [Methanobacterium petrolearium]
MDPVFVGKCAQIASVLEVSGHPKPGNVHRTQNFSDMVFEDFLLSGIAIGKTMEQTAKKGYDLRKTPDKWSSIGLGNLIQEAVTETDRWVANNTNLGIVMLLTPICAAAGAVESFNDLRDTMHKMMMSTTPQDAVHLYQAINIADAGGMGQQEELDVSSDSSMEKLLDDDINMFSVLEMSSAWDRLSYELTNQMPVTFEIGFPLFAKIQSEYGINQATVQTFLTILSKIPDTLISRKYGEEKAKDVLKEAESILEEGGILTDKGQQLLKKFDQYLIDNGLNPGTTADFTASSIMVAYLDSYDDYNNKLSE